MGNISQYKVEKGTIIDKLVHVVFRLSEFSYLIVYE